MMIDCRCLVAIAMIHVICLQLLYTTESAEIKPVQQLSADLAARWPLAYSREQRNGKYMRFGRAWKLPEQVEDDDEMLLGEMDQGGTGAGVKTHPLVSDQVYRYLVESLQRHLANDGSGATVWKAAGEGEKGGS